MSGVPNRLFARLPMPVQVGDIVKLTSTPGLWRVETCKEAEDRRDAKCVVVRVEEPEDQR